MIPTRTYNQRPGPAPARRDTQDMSIRLSRDDVEWLAEIAARRQRSRSHILRAVIAVARAHNEELESCLP